MADHADDDGNEGDDVFVYMGGRQVVPEDVTHVRIHKSVKVITRDAFRYCPNLVSIEMHDGVEIIREGAFYGCISLRGIKLPGVRVIEHAAFCRCTALEDVEFGDKLETIGSSAFHSCTALRIIKVTKGRVIRGYAFYKCEQLTDVELSGDLQTIGSNAFHKCPRLRRIATPLKGNLLGFHVFAECENLSQVDLVGGIDKTISSLLLDSWRNEMNDKIQSVNQVLPNTDPDDKTAVIRQWMRSVLDRIEHYKSKHYVLLKEFTTLLELALWKAKLDEKSPEGRDQPAKKAKIDMKAARQEKRITSGANIVIKNVLPFLELE